MLKEDDVLFGADHKSYIGSEDDESESSNLKEERIECMSEGKILGPEILDQASSDEAVDENNGDFGTENEELYSEEPDSKPYGFPELDSLEIHNGRSDMH